MSYKMLLVLFGLFTLGMIIVLGNGMFLSRRRYIILFQVRPRTRKRSKSAPSVTSPALPPPSFFSWWLKERVLMPALLCGLYLLTAVGVYLVLPLLHPGAKTNKTTSGIPDVSQRQKELWKSYVELSVAAEKNPQDPSLHLELARAQRDLGLGQKALDSYRKVLYLDPLSLDARYEMGCMAVIAGDTTLAATQVAELAVRWPRRPESHLLQARMDLRAGKRAAALAQLRNALTVEPGNREIRILLVDALLQQSAYAEAARLAQEGLKLASIPAPINQRVNGMGKPQSSRASTITLSLLLARSQIGLGDRAKAETILQGVAVADLSTPTPFILLGDLRINRKEYRAALTAYEEALKRDPGNNLLMNNIASLSADHGFDLGRAANLAARMYAKYPSDPAVADTLGWVLCAQGKKDQALPLLRFAAAGAPANPNHRYHFGVTLLKSGQTAQGRKELAAALKISKEFDGAEKARALLGGKE